MFPASAQIFRCTCLDFDSSWGRNHGGRGRTDGHVTIQAFARAEHIAHPTCANGGDDFVGSDVGTRVNYAPTRTAAQTSAPRQCRGQASSPAASEARTGGSPRLPTAPVTFPKYSA